MDGWSWRSRRGRENGEPAVSAIESRCHRIRCRVVVRVISDPVAPCWSQEAGPRAVRRLMIGPAGIPGRRRSRCTGLAVAPRQHRTRPQPYPYGNEPVQGSAAHLSGRSVRGNLQRRGPCGWSTSCTEGTLALGRQVAGAIDPVLPSIEIREVRGRRSKSSRGFNWTRSVLFSPHRCSRNDDYLGRATWRLHRLNLTARAVTSSGSR